MKVLLFGLWPVGCWTSFSASVANSLGAMLFTLKASSATSQAVSVRLQNIGTGERSLDPKGPNQFRAPAGTVATRLNIGLCQSVGWAL